jgi:hypothetical protein
MPYAKWGSTAGGGSADVDRRVDFRNLVADTSVVQRIIAIALLAVFSATGSGWLNYLHLQEHIAPHHLSYAAPNISTPTGEGHDESNCPTCLTLHMPFAASGYVPLLICLGLLIAFLSLLAPRPVARHIPVWIQSRGPPVC